MKRSFPNNFQSPGPNDDRRRPRFMGLNRPRGPPNPNWNPQQQRVFRGYGSPGPRMPFMPNRHPVPGFFNHPPPPPPVGIPSIWRPQSTLVKNIMSVKKKQKKKRMSDTMPHKPFNRDDAERALVAENQLTANSKQLVIRFPDPYLDRNTVLAFHSKIKKVHFQQPSTPRYCFVQLQEDADVQNVMKELRKQTFGQGKLEVELKHESIREKRKYKPEDIDPYILFVGNIGHSTSAEEIKNLYKGCRVDIGPSQKVKNTKYAYVRLDNVDEAIRLLKETHGTIVGDHSLNVRFRRFNGSVGLPGDNVTPQVKRARPSEDDSAMSSLSSGASVLNVKREPFDYDEDRIKKEASDEDDWCDSPYEEQHESYEDHIGSSDVKPEMAAFDEDMLYPEDYDEGEDLEQEEEEYDPSEATDSQSSKTQDNGTDKSLDDTSEILEELRNALHHHNGVDDKKVEQQPLSAQKSPPRYLQQLESELTDDNVFMEELKKIYSQWPTDANNKVGSSSEINTDNS